MKILNVVLVGFFDDQEHIMLNRRNDAEEELWELIGGGVEENEPALSALIREMDEELHYRLDIEQDNVELKEVIKLETDTFIADVHYYTARFPGFEHFSDSDEVTISDLKLFTLEEALSKPLLPMTRHILEKK